MRRGSLRGNARLRRANSVEKEGLRGMDLKDADFCYNEAWGEVREDLGKKRGEGDPDLRKA